MINIQLVLLKVQYAKLATKRKGEKKGRFNVLLFLARKTYLENMVYSYNSSPWSMPKPHKILIIEWMKSSFGRTRKSGTMTNFEDLWAFDVLNVPEI